MTMTLRHPPLRLFHRHQQERSPVMQRIELVRRLLLHVEEHSHDAWIDLWISGYEDDAVSDCVRLLERLRYLETVSVWVGDREFWKSVRPTRSGNRLLDTARNEALWSDKKSDATNLTDYLKSLLRGNANGDMTDSATVASSP
ncbi:MAG TPA: DUF2513 domain-containing protein [Planctomycetaceae bacterium]|nr:DUF2513 domain-containing protein [Planctomycetaceae bacterium]